MSDSAPPTTKSVFVISPIGSNGTPEHRRYKNTLDYIVKKAFTAPEWDVVRADEETSPDSITTQVIGRIVESDLIIADLTDHNPNVFYELAVAHGYKKPVIHMMQVGQKVPFDVVDQRVIFYDLTDPESVDKARSGLISSAAWLESNPGQTRNPLSAYDQFSAISTASGGGAGGEAVAGAIETLSRQVARMEANLRRDVLEDISQPMFLVRPGESLSAGEQALARKVHRQKFLESKLERLRSESDRDEAQEAQVLRKLQHAIAEVDLLRDQLGLTRRK